MAKTVGIKNGQLGKIININGPKVTVQTNTNQNVIFDIREYKHFDYGYGNDYIQGTRYYC